MPPLGHNVSIAMLIWPNFFHFLFQGSRDNISIEIIAFEGAPKVSEEAIKREAELDARLEAKIKGESCCKSQLFTGMIIKKLTHDVIKLF